MVKSSWSRPLAMLFVVVFSFPPYCGHLCKADELEATKNKAKLTASQSTMLAQGAEAREKDGAITATEILAAVEKAEKEIRDMKAQVIITRIIVLLEEKEVSSGRLMYKKQGKIRLEISKPQRKTTVVNDNVIYLHEPEIKQVQRIVIDERRRKDGDPLRYGFIRSVAEIKQLYNIKLIETEHRGGQTYYVLELKPRNDEVSVEYTKVMLWIEEDRWIPVKMKQFEGEDEIETIYELEDVKLNTNISERVFKFKIPRGCEVIEH